MDERDYKAMNKELKQREMNKETKQLVCEHLDKFANERGKYSCEINDAINEFKKDNNLLENVSGWYLSGDKKGIWYHDFEKDITYGINSNGKWMYNKMVIHIDTDYPATQQQAEERLFPFFEKMYPKGTKVRCLQENTTEEIIGTFFSNNLDNRKVYAHQKNNRWKGQCIMKYGILAEIVEESEVDKLKAELRKISDKLKELGQ